VKDRIRELRLAGWSERRIAAQLGVTRHHVRTALEGFRPPAPAHGATWNDGVGLALARAKYREADDEQLPLAEFAYDIADWLDAHTEHQDAGRVAGSLQYIVDGVVNGSNGLTRIHARRARRLIAALSGGGESKAG